MEGELEEWWCVEVGGRREIRVKEWDLPSQALLEALSLIQLEETINWHVLIAANNLAVRCNLSYIFSLGEKKWQEKRKEYHN